MNDKILDDLYSPISGFPTEFGILYPISVFCFNPGDSVDLNSLLDE